MPFILHYFTQSIKHLFVTMNESYVWRCGEERSRFRNFSFTLSAFQYLNFSSAFSSRSAVANGSDYQNYEKHIYQKRYS